MSASAPAAIAESDWRRLHASAGLLFGLEIDDAASDAFQIFLAHLAEWAPRVNLISVTKPAELLDRHLLDSLAPLRFLDGVAKLVDLGSGAGFPGVPIAIMRRELTVFLVEPRGKRANFLRAVRRELGLQNVHVIEGRGEEVPRGVDAVVSRAVRCRAVADFAVRVLGDRGRVILMKKASATSFDARFEVRERFEYRLPDGAEHMVADACLRPNCFT